MVITIGGFMKQVSGTKQKWILSLALLAVLGSQSYFQISSNSLNSFELASRDPAEVLPSPKGIASKPDLAKEQKEADAKRIAELKAGLKKDVDDAQAKIDELKKLTEGRPGATDCTDGSCSSALIKKVVSPLPVEETEAQIRARERKERADEKAEERRQRLADKEEARQDKERIRKEKEEDQKQAEKEKKADEAAKRKEVNADFTEKMKSIEDDCSGEGITCMGQKMTEILKEYSGKDVVKPESAVVTKAFNKYFAESFRLALRDPAAQQQVLATLHEITADLPIEYRQLKEKSLDMVSSATMVEATKINTNFVAAAQLQKAKKFDEALALQIAGTQQRDQLTLNSQLMVNEIRSGTEEAQDPATFNYLKSTYLPNINKILASLIDISGSSLNKLNQTSDVNEFATRSNTRGGGRATSNLLNNGNNSSSGNLLNNVNFGAPTQTQRINRPGTGSF